MDIFAGPILQQMAIFPTCAVPGHARRVRLSAPVGQREFGNIEAAFAR